MSGRCGPRRQRGALLLGILLAVALTSLVLALSVAALAAVQRSVRVAEHRLARSHDARWALRQLARDLAGHGRSGCRLLPWRAGDFAAGEWRLRLPGRELEIVRAGRSGDDLASVQLARQRSEAWRPWSRVWLGSCGGGYALQGGRAHWKGGAGAPELVLTPPLPVAPRAEGVHLSSLQLWLPRERRYRLAPDARGQRLLASETEGGLADGEERVLLEGVKRLGLQLLMRDGCGEAVRWSWREASEWPAGLSPQAARLSLEWYPDDKEDEVSLSSLDLALEPAASCEASP
ncbi:hypothetical protein [Chromobacterium violaceum]|uniref:hypothetical protein n=1 Tax=Chromobacterium violaceum TaxID=536 RepID=UPI00111C769B|nr:hypothetical protein [Chromobacterium violaceum]MBX9266368.1 hypothetical protein [Chromobacterium violaceum]QRO32396.1 hypothetical protein I6K04_18190 [Chromobacterium violaceum]QRQ17803.1 hypothetical protein I6K03_04540 [Chromobacterium violaceum]